MNPKKALFAVILAALPFVVLATLEGTASLLLGVRTFRRDRVAEIGHTEPDTLLGWINRPNVDRPDFYAPGVGLHINAQRVRHVGDVTASPLPGQRRAVCSGDSFTLGYGVSDSVAWCALLAAQDPGLETVNMGQGGYGLDQAYLWYRRDGFAFHPSIHLFAFIEADFHRMESRRQNGIPKPGLMIVGDSVQAVGVPVSRPGVGPLLQRLANASRTLRLYALTAREESRATTAERAARDSATWTLAEATLRDLARRDSLAGAHLVVVFLPMRSDFTEGSADVWRQRLREAADRQEFAYVDLIGPFRQIAPDSINRLFLTESEIAFHGAAGHYTAAGNHWVAEQLRDVVREGTTPHPVSRDPH